MNSRDRIRAAIGHQPVDRVPIDFGGTRQSGISVFAYERLRERLQHGPGTGNQPERREEVPWRPLRVFDVFQMLAEIEPEVALRLGSDCVGLHRRAVAFGIVNEGWRPFTFDERLTAEVPAGFNPERQPTGDLVILRDGEAIGRMPAGGFYFDRLEKYPGATHPDLDTFDPPRLSAADLAHYRTESERLDRTTDLAVIAALGPPYELFNGIGQGGFEEWMLTFGGEPEYVERLYRKLVDVWIENLEAFHGAVGDRIQVLQIADDFGTQRAPFLSPRMFRALVLPAYQRGLDWIHQRTSWKVMLHSDGALYPLLPSIVEMGVDILNPVQTSAAGMQAARLKREFGDQLVFWGGSADPQTTLETGSPEAVAAEVRAQLKEFLPRSGYVFAPVHNVQATVPPENILALFDTALEYGRSAAPA